MPINFDNLSARCLLASARVKRDLGVPREEAREQLLKQGERILRLRVTEALRQAWEVPEPTDETKEGMTQ